MYQRIKLNQLEEYFYKMPERREKGVFFYRINGYNPEIRKFLEGYLECARTCGIVITGKLKNPDENQLSYYDEIMGMEFKTEVPFLERSIRKWLPRLSAGQCENVVNSLHHTLLTMRASGKNDNMLKNAYIKFMCWLYYSFERVLKELGGETLPKVLYEGAVSSYELKMLGIIADAGCDVILLQYAGDEPYRKVDPKLEESFCYAPAEGQPFPDGFSIRILQKEAEDRARLQRLYDTSKIKPVGTNTWLSGDIWKDTRKPVNERGDGPYIYNMLVRIQGVEDKATCVNDLFHWKRGLEEAGRHMFVLEKIMPPTPQETSQYHGKDYKNMEQLLADLTSKIRCETGAELLNQVKSAFIQLLLEESKREGTNLNKIKNKAVYLLCWFDRYRRDLFSHLSPGGYPVFIYFGACKNAQEALFLRFLSGLPLDVLEINTNLQVASVLTDTVLFEKKYEQSAVLERFPLRPDDVSYGTAAYHAEQDLTDILYQDSGIYRNQQFSAAITVSLKTMYEELYLLWDQEAKYRPNFEVMENQVVLPVMMAKISGVKDGNTALYWQDIRKLIVEDTVLITSLPHLSGQNRSHVDEAVPFLKNRKLQISKIKQSPGYAYGIFRDEIQDYVLEKLQELLDSGWVKGTFSQGVEYTIIAVVLHLEQEISRLLQKFDFTKKNPKLIWICTDEKMCSLEDAILIAFLRLSGFDIAMFVPTGYQVVEKYYTKDLFEEYQIGEYLYDLRVPESIRRGSQGGKQQGLFYKLFKRGR